MKALLSLDSWKDDIFCSWDQEKIIIIKMKPIGTNEGTNNVQITITY